VLKRLSECSSPLLHCYHAVERVSSDRHKSARNSVCVGTLCVCVRFRASAQTSLPFLSSSLFLSVCVSPALDIYIYLPQALTTHHTPPLSACAWVSLSLSVSLALDIYIYLPQALMTLEARTTHISLSPSVSLSLTLNIYIYLPQALMTLEARTPHISLSPSVSLSLALDIYIYLPQALMTHHTHPLCACAWVSLARSLCLSLSIYTCIYLKH